MALARGLLSSFALLFLSGAIVMIIITFLGGSTNKSPENNIYFLQANTSRIPGAPGETRWTFWNACRVGADGKSHCGHTSAAFPFDPPSHRNFNTTVNVPPEFIGTNHYFLMTRFMFPFCIIAIFFAVMAWFAGLFSLFSRVTALTCAILTWIALMFQTITTSLMTAAFVQGRKAFNRNGQAAHLGTKAFGLWWASLPLLFLASVLFFIAGFVGKRDKGYTGREHRRRGFFHSRPQGSVTNHTHQTEMST